MPRSGGNKAVSSQFLRPLTHRDQADANAPLIRKANAIVDDLDVQRVIQRQANVAGGRARMADDIGQRLAADAISRHLDGGGQ